MQFKQLYPITITAEIKACHEFYTKFFGLETVFEADWYIQMRHPNGCELAWMLPDLENQPKFLAGNYLGQGMVYSFEVEDAQAEFEKLKQLGATFALQLTDEEWGQRHCMLQDPAGVFIDVVQQLS